MVARPKPFAEMRYRKIVAEFMEGGGIVTMDEAGDVCEYAQPSSVVAAVRKRDRAAARRGQSTVTLIDWLNCPPDFTP